MPSHWCANKVNTSNDDGGSLAIAVEADSSRLLELEVITANGKFVAICVLDVESTFLDEVVQIYQLHLAPQGYTVGDYTVQALLEVHATIVEENDDRFRHTTSGSISVQLMTLDEDGHMQVHPPERVTIQEKWEGILCGLVGCV